MDTRTVDNAIDFFSLPLA